MHNVCRFSQRWHQQFCLSPSFAGHQRCLQRLQPFREYRQATRSRIPRSLPSHNQRDETSPFAQPSSLRASDIVVREYEPNPHDQSKLNRIDPNQEIEEEMENTRRELFKLDQELATMRQGPFGPQSEFMQSIPADERKQLLEALEKEGMLQGEQEDLLTMAELERLSEEAEEEQQSTTGRLGVTLRIPRKDQAYIRHFNKALQSAEEAKGLDLQRNLNLWRWYLRCQQQVYHFSGIVSKDVWHFMWQSQAELKVRPKHVAMLARDILEANKRLEPRQWLEYIEALRASGDAASAVKVWEEQKPYLGTDPETAETLWNTGVQLYSDAGQPAKAQELAFAALNQGKAEPQVLVPVIVAWAQSRDAKALVKAWACYLKLKDKTGWELLPNIYDRISNAFLDVNQGDMALSVFKDMLIMKEPSSHDSKQVYKQATKHFGDVLQNATTEEQINRVGLSALLILPRQFQNRFFFTAWIKKLIGEKRVDSAAMVVELMYERGIAPDAKPLNGIIGAWLREGTNSAQRKAENMAWSMVEARAEFVSRRDNTSEKQGKRYRTITVEDRAESVRRRVPSATIETFSILLQHYTRRQDNARAERLTKIMIDDCQIRPNSYIMNHWLYADLRAGRLQDVWDKYQNLKRDITPDLETFVVLWDTAKVQFSRVVSTRAKDFPSARRLFAEMADWISLVPSVSTNKARQAQDDFSAELYEQIIRCFCLSADLPGTLLAMHHMSRAFGMYPTDNSLRIVCGQAARYLPQEGQVVSRPSRLRRGIPRNQSVLAQVAEIIETIETNRKVALVDEGADPKVVDDPNSDIGHQLRLAVVAEFLCMFMQKAQAKAGSYRNDVKIAAASMHVDLQGVELNFEQ